MKKFHNEPELKILQLVAKLQNEGLVRSFRTNHPIMLGKDVNEREVWAVPDLVLTTTTRPQRVMIIRTMGSKWHPEDSPEDLEQKQRMEKLHYEVLDVRIDGKEDWEEIEASLRHELRTQV